jgi:hypothetical protein
MQYVAVEFHVMHGPPDPCGAPLLAHNTLATGDATASGYPKSLEERKFNLELFPKDELFRN